jgi:hypothetical protein
LHLKKNKKKLERRKKKWSTKGLNSSPKKLPKESRKINDPILPKVRDAILNGTGTHAIGNYIQMYRRL